GGAYDFLPKPIDPNVLQVTLRQASEHVRLQRRVSQLQEELGIYEGRVVAESAGMKRAMRLLRQAVDSNATVLLLGESGTGKGLLARELHRTGPRANGPFIAVNCAAIPDTLLESELFGHEKGAFTGATSRRIGKFEAANGGVLFLDEIGDMPLALQAKLLRVLQDREVERLGSNEPIRLDVRVVAATNVDLEQRIEQNEFREDLYYRLAVLEVFIPPLRERLDDVQPLAAGVVTRAAKDEGRKVTGMSPALIEALQEFDWPGNIRQLENVLTRAVIVAEGEILQRDDLPPAMLKRLRKLREASDVGKAGPEESGDQLTLLPILGFDNEDDIPTLADLDVAVMKRALEVCGGNVTRAAKQLGIGRATLYRRLYADRGQVDDGSDDDSNPSAGD
ncbi:MAG: sigma-54 dependent transcriptional regulator, partial [Planctomycetota bacterium]